jgi:hypothetical protein
MASFLTEIDFGAFPGTSHVVLTVIGQTNIVAGSIVECEIFPKDTVDHSVDEHVIDPPHVVAGLPIVAGTSFTVYGYNKDKNISGTQPGGHGAGDKGYGGGDTLVYGKWTILCATNYT